MVVGWSKILLKFWKDLYWYVDISSNYLQLKWSVSRVEDSKHLTSEWGQNCLKFWSIEAFNIPIGDWKHFTTYWMESRQSIAINWLSLPSTTLCLSSNLADLFIHCLIHHLWLHSWIKQSLNVCSVAWPQVHWLLSAHQEHFLPCSQHLQWVGIIATVLGPAVFDCCHVHVKVMCF